MTQRGARRGRLSLLAILRSFLGRNREMHEQFRRLTKRPDAILRYHNQPSDRNFFVSTSSN